MPLEKGPVGSAAFGRNIATEEKAGKPPKQAEAIAYSETGEKKDGPMDRLDSILAKCDSMEKRVDALCASRKDSDEFKVKVHKVMAATAYKEALWEIEYAPGVKTNVYASTREEALEQAKKW